MKLNPELLLRAYAIGIFPMAESRDDPVVHWIDPDRRGILPLDDFHIPRRLKRRLRRHDFEVRCDQAFDEVISGCAEPGRNRPDTWINRTIEGLYTELHHMGFAHSVECWRDGELVGGLYGVSLGAAFFGESMFSREPDASKIALAHLILRLIIGGYTLLDTQFTTPHLRQFGAQEVSREDYKVRLAQALSVTAQFPVEVADDEVDSFLQSITQTS